jgi:xanthine/uracil/vitamin C permease (AzgA family)
MDFEGSSLAYCVDSFCISMGALVGTSPVTAYIESATGISGTRTVIVSLPVTDMLPEGGKTGITAMVTGLAFLVSVFFAPIFASIPGWATGGALVIVGSLMITKYVPAFTQLTYKQLLFRNHRTNEYYLVLAKLTGTTLGMRFPRSLRLL